MAWLDGLQHWTFQGIALARRITSQSEWDEWFDTDTILSIEPVLDSTERYIDVGGFSYSAMQLIFAFPDEDARATFEGLRGQSGILTRPGRSGLAVFRRFQPLASANDGYRLLSCTFEAL